MRSMEERLWNLVNILQPAFRNITFVLPGSYEQYDMNLSSNELQDILAAYGS